MGECCRSCPSIPKDVGQPMVLHFRNSLRVGTASVGGPFTDRSNSAGTWLRLFADIQGGTEHERNRGEWSKHDASPSVKKAKAAQDAPSDILRALSTIAWRRQKHTSRFVA